MHTVKSETTRNFRKYTSKANKVSTVTPLNRKMAIFPTTHTTHKRLKHLNLGRPQPMKTLKSIKSTALQAGRATNSQDRVIQEKSSKT